MTEGEKQNEIITVEKTKLDLSYDNYRKIINQKLPYKFVGLESWLYNKSNKLLFETKTKNMRYKRYSRGTIIKLDFGVNVGTEFSLNHFAIVISKKDTIYNDLLTVIPLTSKDHGKHTILLDKLITDIILNNLCDEVNKLTEEMQDIPIQQADFISSKVTEKISKIQQIIDLYSNQNELSYACINQIQSVSKLKILKPINEYDIVGKKCPDEVLKKIDIEIIKRFTNYDYREVEKIKFDN